MDYTRVKGFRPITLSFALIVLICMMLIAPAAAEETLPARVYVNASYDEDTPGYGDCNFSSIQEAIDGVAEGGEVLVYGGMYDGAIVIKRSMTVTATSDLEEVILGVQDGEIAVEISANDVVFSAFTISGLFGAGISVHNASAVEIQSCEISTVSDSGGPTYGVLIKDSERVSLHSSSISIIGGGEQCGVMIRGVNEACIHGNWIEAASYNPAPEGDNIIFGWIPAIASDAPDDPPAAEPRGIVIIESNSVLVEDNQVNSRGVSVTGEFGSDTPAVDVLGIWSDRSGNVEILRNEVYTDSLSTDSIMATGIKANGNFTLIQNNTIRSYSIGSGDLRTAGAGIQIDEVQEGQILDNDIDIGILHAGATEESWYVLGGGIIATDSYKARILRNDVVYMVQADSWSDAIRARIRGISIYGCDEAHMSENVVIVEGEILMMPPDCEHPVILFGQLAGINAWESDDIEIVKNVLYTSGNIQAYDLKAKPDDLPRGVIEELIAVGIQIQGDLESPLKNPLISDNVILVDAQVGGGAGVRDHFVGSMATLPCSSDLAGRYNAVIQRLQEETSAFRRMSALESEPEIDENTFVQAYTITAGIVIQDALDPVICRNHVPVYQDTLIAAYNAPIPDDMIVFANRQSGPAALFSQELDPSGADRSMIMDTDPFAPGSGIADIIGELLVFLGDKDSSGLPDPAWIATVDPTSMSYGLFCSAEGVAEIYENNFTVLTCATSRATAGSGGADISGTVAESTGIITAFGISGVSDGINVAENCINVTTIGDYLDTAKGDEVWGGSAMAEAKHLFFATGVSADALERSILDNEITVRQEASTRAVTLTQNDSPLSTVTTEGVAIGIVLNSDEFDDIMEISRPTLPAPGAGFADVVMGNNILVISEIEEDATATMELPAPRDGSPDSFSVVVGTSEGFGIIAPEADIEDNTIEVLVYKSNHAQTLVEAIHAIAARQDVSDPANEGGFNFAIVSSRGILTMGSCVSNNVIETVANIRGFADADLLDDAGDFTFCMAVDIGIASMGPSSITGNTVNGRAYTSFMGIDNGEWVDSDALNLALDFGILSVGGSAIFNNIQNGYIGYPYYDGEESYEPYAFYNWWGDVSGPSDLGPGTGSPVAGTMNYEPWLTQPADVVLKTGRSYFGLEIGSPNIGGGRCGLEPGWNTLSFPLALENNTWQEVTHAGDGLDYAVAWRWDATDQRWVQMTGASKVNPLDAVYILMNDHDRLPVAISPEITSPPTKALKAGWNLIGPAYDLRKGPTGETYLWWGDLCGTSVRKALVSVEKAPGGLTGYVIVVSPPVNPAAWVYTPGDDTVPDMDATLGYWVYMENPDELAGFSTTPLPMPRWACEGRP